MDKLQSWAIGMVNISAPSFKNLPHKLSIPAALFVWQFFKRSEIHLFELFEKLIF